MVEWGLWLSVSVLLSLRVITLEQPLLLQCTVTGTHPFALGAS